MYSSKVHLRTLWNSFKQVSKNHLSNVLNMFSVHWVRTFVIQRLAVGNSFLNIRLVEYTRGKYQQEETWRGLEQTGENIAQTITFTQASVTFFFLPTISPIANVLTFDLTKTVRNKKQNLECKAGAVVKNSVFLRSLGSVWEYKASRNASLVQNSPLLSAAGTNIRALLRLFPENQPPPSRCTG